MVSLSKEYVSKNSEVSCHLPGNRENLLFHDFTVLALNLNGSWKSWLPLLFYHFMSRKNVFSFIFIVKTSYSHITSYAVVH